VTDDRITPLSPARTVIKPYGSDVYHAAVANEHGNYVPLCSGVSYWMPDHLNRDKFHTDLSVNCGNCVRTRYWKDVLKPLVDEELKTLALRRGKEQGLPLSQLAKAMEEVGEEIREQEALLAEEEEVEGITPDRLDALSNFARAVVEEMWVLEEKGFSFPSHLIVHHKDHSGEFWISQAPNGTPLIDFIS